MEEVDKIIIDSLKHLECDIGDDIQNLKQFDADMIVSAISACLEAITSKSSFPKKLPPSMSSRLKIASDLADCIKDLGFRGDMGYQTILYCNEVDVRRVLMFLIERLPRESNKTTVVEEMGYVPSLVKAIDENIKNFINQMWIPSSFLYNGVRECERGYIINSLGNSCPLVTETLVIPDSKTENEALKQYWVHIIPDVTRQCSSRKLIASLLFKDNELSQNSNIPNFIRNQNQTGVIEEMQSSLEIISKENVHISEEREAVRSETTLDEKKDDGLLQELDDIKSRYSTLQETVKKSELQLSETRTMKNEEQNVLKDTIAKVKLKTKTLAVMNKEENMTKLKNLIQIARDRLVELSSQWNEVETPLLDEYRSLQNTLTTEEAKIREDQFKLNKVKETRSKLEEDMKEKVNLEKILLQKCQNMNRTNSRSAYTSRILEIIGNIRKQNAEIQNVLKDTKVIQKDINNLAGQVDRSFTLSDEMIFFDAKYDETARSTYKLLATLRDECSSILTAVNDLGLVERECRNLQEQIEMEKSKEIGVKLERVLSDLALIQKETQLLVKQLES